MHITSTLARPFSPRRYIFYISLVERYFVEPFDAKAKLYFLASALVIVFYDSSKQTLMAKSLLVHMYFFFVSHVFQRRVEHLILNYHFALLFET